MHAAPVRSNEHNRTTLLSSFWSSTSIKLLNTALLQGKPFTGFVRSKFPLLFCTCTLYESIKNWPRFCPRPRPWKSCTDVVTVFQKKKSERRVGSGNVFDLTSKSPHFLLHCNQAKRVAELLDNVQIELWPTHTGDQRSCDSLIMTACGSTDRVNVNNPREIVKCLVPRPERNNTRKFELWNLIYF